jgi:nuclear pore complex protein Nup98-Nup96
MFGGGNSTFGGGFGGGAATNNTTTSGFGGTNTSGGGLFGSKPSGFGTAATTTGSSNMFGASNNTSGGFGTNTSTGFGTSNTSGGFGAGASNIAPNNGTGTTPFQAIQEKEAGNANSQAQYQTITFMQPYQNFSLEELRSVDYNQGRRFGNQNGQGGAFGQSTGFGGFGTTNNASTGFGSTNTTTNTGGGLFGSTNTNTNTGFGTSTGSAFGTNNNAGGGLFGANNTQNKPATGLFGSTTASTGTTGGGLFGNNNNNTNTGGGFGSGSGGFGASTGGGVFGNNNPAQNKPAFGGFGSTNTNTATTGFGGNTANTGSSLFGGAAQNNTTPAFGTNNQAAPAGNGLFGNSGGGFGQTPQNQQQPQQSGGLFGGGGGGFGQNAQNNQQKPAGMFGAAPATGGGLFGNNQQQQQQPATGGLFGQSKPATGGLFGNTNAAQPAQTGGLFGNSGGATGATGGGLFGNLGGQNNQQNAAGGGLFGASNNQPKPGGLFGNSTGTNNNANGGLFGSSSMGQNNQNGHQLGGSLFGGQSQGQQNQPAMNNSLFGASGNSTLQTSMNTNPYGNDALFTGLATPTQSPGPLATPLSSSQKNRKSAVLPQHKLNPSQSTRLLTPQGKRNTGYGFTYSTYGTPNNGSSQNSPLNGSLFSNGSLSRQFGKSMSSSNLRHTFTPDTSILAPGAFSTNGRSFGNGSLKKLNINRAINARRNLFPQDEEGEGSPAKRVTFTDNGDDVVTTLTNGSNSTELILRQEDEPTSMNGEASKATNTRPEMEQVKPTVSENTVLKPRTSSSLNIQNGQVVDPTPGEYYSEPSLDTLKSMSKRELESVPNFVVGRDGVGKIEFNFGKPINLSDIVLDKIFGGIVVFDPRNVTVYGRDYEGKPQLGAPGLNHPSRIILGNSWPKGTSHKKEDHYHIERLKKVQGTKFEAYVPETGDWIFQVAHFSSYGLNYEDDLEEESEESSSLSPVPETPSQLGSSQISNTPGNDSLASASQSSPDDTFDFKKDMRKRANVPGQFGDEVAYEEDDEEMEENHGESFLGERSVDSLEGQQDYQDESGSELVEDQEMADSVSGPIRATERNNAKEMDLFKDSMKPKSILKTSQVLRPMGTPSKGPFVFDDDWANALQRTISPKKQDRQALRESQGDMLRGRDDNATFTQSVRGQPFKTTMGRMDLMDSLFAETDKRKDSTTTKRVAQGIQV